MFGNRAHVKRNNKDEAEKPFWISFADLMTALMVLFLVVMCVALLAVTKDEGLHEKNIERILDSFEAAAVKHPDIKVKIDRTRHVIDFGERAQFGSGDWRLNTQQEEVLRKFVPEIIALANDDLGAKILKRIVVEGYTDKNGSYLFNLNLSLQRSQRVLCALLATSGPSLLDEGQKENVRNLFSVGGYSFNAAKKGDDESRRVEMRLEFLGINEKLENSASAPGNFGECALR
jgi:outer membrane protein OmpA-like peptidoglycan-associated protein